MANKMLRVPAPAKLNLCLKISGRRDDGYHELHTIFHFLDCCDYLDFELRADETLGFSCNKSELENESNLVVRAAQTLQDYCVSQGLPKQGCNIYLEKHLPMQGGIGAGSSNAATCLLVLNKLWNVNLDLNQLADMSLALGADVPVFVRGQSAVGEGRGELLKPLTVPEFYYVLVKPKTSVSTAAIFAHQELTRDSSPRTIRAFLSGGQGKLQSFQGLLELIKPGNDCEVLVRKLYPEVNLCLGLLAGFGLARLTGTGACVFAPFETQDAAEKAGFALKENPLIEQVIIAKGMNSSPVHTLLDYKI